MSTQSTLCASFFPKTDFYLVEEIKILARKLDKFTFTIHWIPSHIERTIKGNVPIRGNFTADQLATNARLHAQDHIPDDNIGRVRDQILVLSASLLSSISTLLSDTPLDGPSLDDCRSSAAIQGSREKREHL